MMKKFRIVAPTVSLVLLLVHSVAAPANPYLPGAVAPGDSWQEAPFDFVFGNHMDTHVQLALLTLGGEPRFLVGSLYIYFTGEVDETSGLPIARHPRGAMHGEVCGADEFTCEVGWYVVGSPGAAKFLSHSGVNGMDHPIWMVNRAEESSAPAVGMVIPQPGYYSHFHWLSAGSTDPRAGMVPKFCDKMSAGMLEMAEPSATDMICEGWFLQLLATRDFAFKHGGESIVIRKGADLRSHLNIVTNYQAETVVTITPTRTHSGGH